MRTATIDILALLLLNLGSSTSADESAEPSMGAANTTPMTAEAGNPTEPAPAPKPAPARQPFRGVFYENDFAYLDEPGTAKSEYFELLKRLVRTEHLRLDLGGEFRHQFKNEDRRSLFRGTPTVPRADSFSLSRVRLYGDVLFCDGLRGYVEYLDAVSTHEELFPLAIDENRSDFLNAFGEVVLFASPAGRETWVRAGRQELLYDAERLISPPDWGNTRRTFEGAKLFSRGPDLDLDLFWTRPVLVFPRSLDQPDQSQWFAGVHAAYKGFPHATISPYLLILREEDVIPGAVTGATHRVGSGNHDNRLYTLGNRINGQKNDWLWDLEGALQLGQSDTADVVAGMVAAGIGRNLTSLPWNPTVWAWYDYASGDEDPADEITTTFNQLFPLAHKYFGFLDLIARQNIHDLNYQLFLRPNKKLTLLTWLHLFWLAEGRDALYNAAGVASRQSPVDGVGSEVGQEIDLLASYAVRPGIELQIGYSHFWSGQFVRGTGDGADAYLVYTQLSVKF